MKRETFLRQAEESYRAALLAALDDNDPLFQLAWVNATSYIAMALCNAEDVEED